MIDPFLALGFMAGPDNRRADLRDRPEDLAALRASPDAGVMICAGDAPVLARRGETCDGFFTAAAARAFGPPVMSVFLGFDGARPLFADEIDAASAERLKDDPALVVTDARSIAIEKRLDPVAIGALASAKALFHWHRTHRFCAACGVASRPASAGWKRICDACGHQHFPRTDPVVIMLAIKGDTCLLGRQSRFPEGMYSCLAGFVEPGETLEAAVRRETLEEAGVTTGRVRYRASQPWPFPASLMIGCFAEALGTTLTIDHDEIEDARFFTRDEVRAMIEGRHPQGLLAPQPMAIANALMRSWALDGEGV